MLELKLEQIKKEIIANLSKVKNLSALRDLEIKYLGRKGELTNFLKGIINLSENDKKIIGKLANEAKNDIENKISEARMIIEGKESKEAIDITLPGLSFPAGRLHPITLIQNELEDIFTSMGFMILDGPELESDYFNFEALNIPKYHPARDMQDTFYVDKKNEKGEYDLVMRTHTSPVQVRAMQKYGAPLRGVVPGRVFRAEAIDASHEHTFDQIEGFIIDKEISISNLIVVLREMLSRILKRQVKIRVRPGYFPFVEPGLEVDMGCAFCLNKGCSACKQSGWVEMLGAGLIHPNVLKAGGIDPNMYSGFAFGLGITRLAMIKYGINDIRLFNSGDMRFLEQF
jgi:phenylalanyl-tRNA synthetase alpha chain